MARSLLPLALLSLLGLAGCAKSAGIEPTGGQGNDPVLPGELCLLSNCDQDSDCAACDGGRTTCRVEDHRCVACDEDTATGCPADQVCSSWGNCIPIGLTCETDQHGLPAITCATNADCAACDPEHQICDPSSNRCVTCTSTDTAYCQSTDVCIDGGCVAKCPMDCTSDADCSDCGSGAHALHACNFHKCSECSDTQPCPGGETCTAAGTCVSSCGADGSGACETDADCQFCEGDLKVCHAPANGGPGTCGASAAGCSDLGQGVAVLPDPWDDYTNLCSNDGDCAGVGITLNVGKVLRDLTGFDQIGDANVEYGMNACASVSVGLGGESLSCGVCVPCKVDSDCSPIDVDALSGQLFGGLGGAAASFLLDQIFGPNEHAVQMYCSPVAADYGVCAPCPGVFTECGGGGGQVLGGSCAHDECATGGALDPSCGSCEADVCAQDSFCCDGNAGAWDQLCVQQAEQLCAVSCGGGGGASACAHDTCDAGGKLASGCDPCVTDVCAADDYCCATAWDAQCVGEAESICGLSCGGGGGGGSCSHDACDVGGKLVSGCDPCVTDVCAVDDYCCATSWDSTCVGEAESICGLSCGGGGGGGGPVCVHDVCDAGAKLASGCDPCATDVCAVDDYCCTTQWDQTCVGEAESICGISCGGGPACAHDICVAGGALDPSCDPCASDVCAADDYCCTTQWDQTCVGEAESICGIAC